MENESHLTNKPPLSPGINFKRFCKRRGMVEKLELKWPEIWHTAMIWSENQHHLAAKRHLLSKSITELCHLPVMGEDGLSFKTILKWVHFKCRVVQ
jgi:hypothetical protein